MERVKKILHELMEEMKINEGIKLKIVPMKQKIASLSLKTKTLRLNEKAVNVLSDEEIRYILIHELIHLKIKDASHGSSFLHELRKHYSPEDGYNLEIKIIKKMLENIETGDREKSLKYSVNPDTHLIQTKS